MIAAADDLRFEYAAQLRDEIRELRRDLREAQAAEASADRRVSAGRRRAGARRDPLRRSARRRRNERATSTSRWGRLETSWSWTARASKDATFRSRDEGTTRRPSTPICARSRPMCRSCVNAPSPAVQLSRSARRRRVRCRAFWRPQRRLRRTSNVTPPKMRRRCARRPRRTPSGCAPRRSSGRRRTSRPSRRPRRCCWSAWPRWTVRSVCSCRACRPVRVAWRLTSHRSRPTWASSTTRLVGGSRRRWGTRVARALRLEGSRRLANPRARRSRLLLRRHPSRHRLSLRRPRLPHQSLRCRRSRRRSSQRNELSQRLLSGRVRRHRSRPRRVSAPVPAVGEAGGAPASTDLDGARLIALNMALNGESREQADRYLQENFQLADRSKLLDEVYAAIEV